MEFGVAATAPFGAAQQGAVPGGDTKSRWPLLTTMDVVFGVETAAPEFAGGAFEGVTGKAAGVDEDGSDVSRLSVTVIRRLGRGGDVALGDGDS